MLIRLRQKISELGAIAETSPQPGERPIHTAFIYHAKRHLFGKIFYDAATDKWIGNFKMLLLSILLSKVIRKIDLIAQSMTIDFDGRMAAYDFAMTEELELAYAITVHKSQGSEYPIVVIPLYRYTPKLLTRNLFYTAITRAQQMVILVGNGEVAHMMTDNNRQTKRYTGLAYFMTQYE